MAKCAFTSPGRRCRPPDLPTHTRKDAMGRHDSGYKLLFSHPYLIESLIRGFVPGTWIDRLDFSSLEPVSEAHPRDEIGVRYDDMIWRLRWRDSGERIYVYLLLEFQSNDDPFMAVRVLDYDGGLYHQLVRALKLKRGDKLPLVLPVVLYRGQPDWLTRVFLPSRLPGVTVPEVKRLEEVSPMIAENAIDWSAQWREEGRQEGRQEGEADLLLRQIRRLYGPLASAVEARVRGAKADQLLEWGERLVTSRSLDEVFGRSQED